MSVSMKGSSSLARQQTAASGSELSVRAREPHEAQLVEVLLGYK